MSQKDRLIFVLKTKGFYFHAAQSMGIKFPAHVMYEIREDGHPILTYKDFQNIAHKRKYITTFRILFKDISHSGIKCFYCKYDIRQGSNLDPEQRLEYGRCACHICLQVLKELKRKRSEWRKAIKRSKDAKQMELFDE